MLTLATASMASLSSASCLPRASASIVRHPISSRVGLSCTRLVNSSFNGVRFRVPLTQTGVRKLRVSSIRAAGAKGDYIVKKVSARELDDILTNKRDLPIVIDFYATWCGPCILLAQQLEELAVEYTDNVQFLKVDTDEEHELCAQMEIRGLPTMVFVHQDKEKRAIRTEGLLPTDVIRDIIKQELGASQWEPGVTPI